MLAFAARAHFLDRLIAAVTCAQDAEKISLPNVLFWQECVCVGLACDATQDAKQNNAAKWGAAVKEVLRGIVGFLAVGLHHRSPAMGARTGREGKTLPARCSAWMRRRMGEAVGLLCREPWVSR